MDDDEDMPVPVMVVKPTPGGVSSGDVKAQATSASSSSSSASLPLAVPARAAPTGPMHQRCDCEKFLFSSLAIPHSTACDQCLCYVCDVPWKQCKNWGTHCDADLRGAYKTMWQKEREKVQRGGPAAAAVKQEAGEGKAADSDSASSAALDSSDDDDDDVGAPPGYGAYGAGHLGVPWGAAIRRDPAVRQVYRFEHSMKKFDAEEDAGYVRSKMIKFMDRSVPAVIFECLTKFKATSEATDVEKAYARRIYDKILSDTCNYRLMGYGDHASHNPRNFSVIDENISYIALKDMSKLLKKIGDKLGKNHSGSAIFAYQISPGRFGVVQGGTNINIQIQPFYPLPSELMPPEPFCWGADTRNRKACSACTYLSPVAYDKSICKACHLYTFVNAAGRVSNVAAAQKPPLPIYVQIGRPIPVACIIKPNNLKPAQRNTRVLKQIADPYVAAAMQEQQITRFRASELGTEPIVDVIVRMGGGLHSFNSNQGIDCNNTELHLASSYPLAGTDGWSLERRHMHGFLDSAQRVNKKIGCGLFVHCEVADFTPPTVEPDLAQWKKKSSAEKASYFTINFRLYLDPTVTHGGFAPEPSFWGPEKELFSYFLTPVLVPPLRSDLEDKHPVKDSLLADDVLLPSKPGFGAHAELTTGVGGLLSSIIRESLRLGLKPPGFASEDPLMYERTQLPAACVRQLPPLTEAQRGALAKRSSQGSTRYHAVAESLADVMTDLENLGHSTLDESPRGVGRFLQGLTCELRNYQKQSLRWALDQEHREGGLASHICAELHAHNGAPTGTFYSPFTGALFCERPEDVRGGFICEEMGMGKTIITLGLILCNPPPKSTVGPEADTAWGEYSPSSTVAAKREREAAAAAKRLRDAQARAVAQRNQALVQQALGAAGGVAMGFLGAMGLGLGLIAPAPVAAAVEEEKDADAEGDVVEGIDLLTDRPSHRSRGTLVICPVSLVGQWCSEAKAKLVAGNFKIHEYHGQNRIRDPAKLSAFDLVVTTYETLSSDMRLYEKNKSKDKYPAVSKINWFRIVCDESHKGKSKNHMSLSLFGLFGKRRWCVTGTPVNTNLTDFAGQFRVMGMPLVCETSWWKSMTLKDGRSRMRRHQTALRHDAMSSNFGYAAVMSLLRRTVIRHTKNMTYASSGEGLLVLPPKVEIVQWIKFSDEEEAMYKQLEGHMLKQYRVISAMGQDAIACRTIQLLAYVKDLQMACSGGLMPNRIAHILETKVDLAGALPDPDAEECSICFDLMDRPLETPCKHKFCGDCITGVIAASALDKALCPLCRGPLKACDLRRPGGLPDEPAIPDPADMSREERLALSLPSNTVMLSKLKWLVYKLRELHREDRTAKVLVFSQFNQTLEWLQQELPKMGFSFRTLRGDMTLAARKKALEEFQNDPPTTIFLLSLRAGAVGVNLTQANHVVVMEPCLNTALEDQAIGRVYRMGQKREVRVYRVACKGSVEERIIMLQRIRKEAGNEAKKLAEARVAALETVEELVNIPFTVTASSEYPGGYAGNVQFTALDTQWSSLLKIRAGDPHSGQTLTLTLPLDKFNWKEIDYIPCQAGHAHGAQPPAHMAIHYYRAALEGTPPQSLLIKDPISLAKANPRADALNWIPLVRRSDAALADLSSGRVGNTPQGDLFKQIRLTVRQTHGGRSRCGIIAVRVRGTPKTESQQLNALRAGQREEAVAAAKNQALGAGGAGGAGGGGDDDDDDTACPGQRVAAAAAAAAAPTLLDQLRALGGNPDAAAGGGAAAGHQGGHRGRGGAAPSVAAGSLIVDKVVFDKRQYDILFGLEVLPADIVKQLDEKNPIRVETFEANGQAMADAAAADDGRGGGGGYGGGAGAGRGRRRGSARSFIADDDEDDDDDDDDDFLERSSSRKRPARQSSTPDDPSVLANDRLLAVLSGEIEEEDGGDAEIAAGAASSSSSSSSSSAAAGTAATARGKAASRRQQPPPRLARVDSWDAMGPEDGQGGGIGKRRRRPSARAAAAASTEELVKANPYMEMSDHDDDDDADAKSRSSRSSRGSRGSGQKAKASSSAAAAAAAAATESKGSNKSNGNGKATDKGKGKGRDDDWDGDEDEEDEDTRTESDSESDAADDLSDVSDAAPKKKGRGNSSSSSSGRGRGR